MIPKIRKTARLVFMTGRKCVSAPVEASLLFRMAWWVAILSCAAKIYSLPRALELVSGRASHHQDSQNSEIPTHLAKSIDLLLSADVLFIKPICWKRAAVLRRYLSQEGFATKILFGVTTEDKGEVTGHAWLELNGKPILESEPPEYVVTYTFPPEDNLTSQLAILPSD
jgi:hypothetical protein